jgi:hypothetical protein
MWSYYGSKSKIVNYYPKPKYKKIIEPFAGSARYSLLYFENDILLYDKYPKIVKLWKYLQSASVGDILGLPDMEYGQNVNMFNLTEEEKFLIGFCINGGSARPKKTVSKFQSWNKDKIKIANSLYKIRHWNIQEGDYQSIENGSATWFIDPPYQNGGQYYVKSNKDINFDNLANWCKSRNGQIMVCENTKANWLPFKPLVEMQGLKHKTTESMYLKEM